MGWVDDLAGRVVAVDSAPFIYYIEEHPAYLAALDPFFVAISRAEVQVVTSTVTLVEVLTQPVRRGNGQLAQRYRSQLLRSPGVTTVPLSSRVAVWAARLRAAHHLSTPDAVQLATAITARATHFLTNDARLARVTGVQVLVLDALRMLDE